MNVYEKELTDEDYEEKLNNIYGPVHICGLEFKSGWVLKKLDPIAFQCGLADMPIIYCCGECDTKYPDDEDTAKECCKKDV